MSQDKSNDELTETVQQSLEGKEPPVVDSAPFYNHWAFYANKAGIGQLQVVNVKQYADLKQTFYAGALAALATLEKRGIDLGQVDDIVMELIQFTKSQNDKVDSSDEEQGEPSRIQIIPTEQEFADDLEKLEITDRQA